MGYGIKAIEATGNYVVLKLEEAKKKDMYEKKGSLLVQTDGPDQKSKIQAKVFHIGPKADNELGFKVGDIVVFNDYDAKHVGEMETGMYVITRDVSIMAIYESLES